MNNDIAHALAALSGDSPADGDALTLAVQRTVDRHLRRWTLALVTLALFAGGLLGTFVQSITFRQATVAVLNTADKIGTASSKAKDALAAATKSQAAAESASSKAEDASKRAVEASAAAALAASSAALEAASRVQQVANEAVRSDPNFKNAILTAANEELKRLAGTVQNLQEQVIAAKALAASAVAVFEQDSEFLLWGDRFKPAERVGPLDDQGECYETIMRLKRPAPPGANITAWLQGYSAVKNVSPGAKFAVLGAQILADRNSIRITIAVQKNSSPEWFRVTYQVLAPAGAK